MSEPHSTAPASAGKPTKPAKPYPDYPLTAHPAGYWCKKIKGRLFYFGPWSDPDAALAKYLEQKDTLHAGRTPRPDPEALTVKDVANAFLNAKREAVAAGELSRRTWLDYRSVMEMLVGGLGKHRPVAGLDPQDFATLKSKLARRNGPARMSTVVQVIRCAFKHAYESGLLDRPVRFGPVFKRTSRKVLRLHRAKRGAKLFSAEEVRRMLDAAGQPLRAMILLGVNAAYGNEDCGRLPLSALDLDTGWATYPRPKTGLPRRAALWPETVLALREAIALRPAPRGPADAGLVFITKYGAAWSKAENAGPLTQAVRKLLDKLGINGRKGLGFYTLRHTFRTVADGAKDQPAADLVMGHEVAHMSSVYREGIDDTRLRAVAGHVRAWLFGPAGALPGAAGGA
jgi:integrase